MKLLYLCYNNKGRSPALEAFTRYFLEKRGVGDVFVDSAGVGVESIISLRQTTSQISRMTRKILSDEYGLDLESKKIKHLGEAGRDWDLVLAADQHTVDLVGEQFAYLFGRTMLAKDYAAYKGSLEIHGPYYYHQRMDESEWTERLGYDIMLNEVKNVSRRVAKRIERERGSKRNI